MTFEIWIAFVFAASANILAPGPAIVLAIRNGLSLGMGKTAYSTFGNITAIGCVGLAVTLGLGAIITAEPNIVSAMRVLGGGYLIWLAYQNWQNGMISLDHLTESKVFHNEKKTVGNAETDAKTEFSTGSPSNAGVKKSESIKVGSAPYLFNQSLIVGLTNPKMIIFLLALFPLFLDNTQPATPQFLLMTVTFMGLSFISLSGFALTAVKLARLIRQEAVVRLINKFIALIFFGFGIALVTGGVTGGLLG
ncbi:MAG: LysE family translocator [Halopseudomonas aestusnigri]